MKTLVAYFSAESGKTMRVAKSFAERTGADLFEIEPEVRYSDADLNWRNPVARCNVEHLMNKEVPVKNRVEKWEEYDTVFLGFPIWYGCAPNVVNTFCKAYDWSGKKLYVFATSGGGGIGNTAKKLEPYVKGAEPVEAKLTQTSDELISWAQEL